MIMELWTQQQPHEDPLWLLNCLVYTSAVVVYNRVQNGTLRKPYPQNRTLRRKKRQPTERNERKVSHYRRMLSWISQEVQRQQEGKRATKRQQKIRRTLMKVVGCLHIQSLKEAREKYRSLLKIASNQARRKRERKEAARLNKM